MTERLRDDQLDREIRTFLAWQAEDVGDAPNATDVALRIGSRVSPLPAFGQSRARLVWVALTLLLLAAVATAALLSGVIPPRPNPPVSRSYEAVFLRLAADGPTIDVIVFAIKPNGDERELAHFPTAAPLEDEGVNGPNAQIANWAAVSTTGLLALPRTTGNYLFRWAIVDLDRPEAAPIEVPGFEQDYDVRSAGFASGHPRPQAVWGPGERVAVSMYKRTESSGDYYISMVEGRTGVGTSIPFPDASILPYWAADGSGLIAMPASSPREAQVFRMDGSVVGDAVRFANDGHERRYLADGTPSGAFADYDPGGYVDGSPEQLLLDHGAELGDVAWTADGAGRWLIRLGVDDHRIHLDRLADAGASAVATLRYDDPLPADAVDVGWLAGLAPDDSMLVIYRARFTDVSIEGYGGGSPLFDSALATTREIVVPDTGRRFDVQGYFAGWLEVGT